MKTIQIIIILLFFSACNQPKENSEDIQNNPEPITTKSIGDTTNADSDLIKEYQQLKNNGSDFEKKVSEKILTNIDKFSGKSAYFETFTIGNIDGKEPLDTIISIVWVKNDTVYLNSKWLRNNELIWEQKLTNPYLYVSENSIFDYESSPVWTRFTIAKEYAIPEVSPRSRYNNIPIEYVINSGIQKLNVDRNEYHNYLNNFNGELLTIGEPELNKLSIWFEPSKKFVSYYQP